MSLFEELKRRNVVRIAALYAVASWVILQIADVLFENLSVPDWSFRLVLGLLLLGFPVALIFAWVFELTPEGIKRESEIDRSQSITPQTGKRMNRMIIGLLMLVIVLLVAERWLLPQVDSGPATATTAAETASEKKTEGVIPASERSLAVLPFVNMSGDEENEYFSDGLSEELLNSLARIPELQVTGRTSSFAFKGKNEDLREIGQQLNVAHVLEGSVRKAKDTVRITAQLINTDSGYHLWSDTYDRKLDDIFAIQSDIADRVANALSVTLLGTAEASEPGDTQNTAAYEAYLRGNHILQRNPDDIEALEQAKKFYEQALVADPGYTKAWYGLYLYWDRRHRNGIGLQKDSVMEMQKIADQLAAVAPESEEALLAQARMQLVNFNYPRAIELFKRQMKLFPGSVESLRYGATAEMLQSNLKAAIETYDKAIELDPLNLTTLVNLTVPLANTGRCDRARDVMERVLELQPDYGRVRGGLGYCLLMNGGDLQQAIRLLEDEPTGWMNKTGLAIAADRQENRSVSQQYLDSMIEEYGNTAAYQYAEIEAQRGDTDEAIKWLNIAFDVSDPGFINVCNDPFLNPVRTDPRFAELIRKTGLDDCQNPQ